MDLFDERILAALKDGKPRGFTVLLGEVGFSHNTLQQHLERLRAKGLIVREKETANSFGRPNSRIMCHPGPQSRSLLPSKIRTLN